MYQPEGNQWPVILREMQSRENIDWSQLARYLSGELSRDEEAEIEAWIAADPEHASLFEEVRLAWEQSDLPFKQRDHNQAWAQIQAKMRRRQSLRPARPPQRVARRRIDSGRFVRMAAVFVVAVVGAWLATRYVGFGTLDAPSGRQYATERGERATIVLEDGTTVRLNVGSALTVPEEFSAMARKVRLEGEAFFEVARDTLRPFFVEAGAAKVQVLGTSFNVRAYAETSDIEVYVATGRVALGAVDAEVTRDTVVLLPRQLGVASGSGVRRDQINLSAEDYLGWTNGRLVFRDARFDEVVTELERWYDLDIEFDVSVDEIVPFTSTFSDEPLSEILQAVSQTLGLQFERERRSIIFYRNDPLRAE